MNWRSSNIWYAVALAPLLAAATALAYLVLAPSAWAYLPPAVAAALLIWGGRKIAFLPRPARDYGEMTDVPVRVPRRYGVTLRACPSMDRYAFIPRVAELLSPFRFGPQAAPVVAVSPGALARHGERFVVMAAVREIERYRRHGRLKTIVHLLAPLLALGCGVLLLLLRGQEWFGPVVTNFAAPFAFSLLVIGHLLTWNRSVSRRERELDDVLADLFSPAEVREFIEISEGMEQGLDGEKCRALNEYYMRERLKRLH